MSGSNHGRNGSSLALYGASHAVVDALSAGMLLTLWQRQIATPLEFGALFLLYNFIAFATQPLLGLLVDRLQRPRIAALAGAVFTALAVVDFVRWPLLSVCLAGLGNAVFHLGAGTIALQLTPGRATAPGIFVAPGDLGIFAGTYLGLAGSFHAWPFVASLALLLAGALALPLPPPVKVEPGQRAVSPRVLVPLGLLLACVAIRSLLGFSISLPWKSELSLAVTLVVLITLGKAVGGVLADRVGWMRIAVGALLIATPLLAFGATVPAAALAGMFLFNFTMPVTLVATVSLFPHRPAFGFGLTCLALQLGAWPLLQPSAQASLYGAPWVVFGLGFGAAIALYAVLRRWISS